MLSVNVLLLLLYLKFHGADFPILLDVMLTYMYIMFICIHKHMH